MNDEIISYKIRDAFQTVNTDSVETILYSLEDRLNFDEMI